MYGKSNILFCIVLAVCLSSTPALCSAEEAYRISSGELDRLERNLNELNSINERQNRESKTLKDQLEASQTQLKEAGIQSGMLKEQLAGLKLVISEQGASLQTANRLLKQYEEEEKYKLRKAKRQRNIAYLIAIGAVIFAVRKATN